MINPERIAANLESVRRRIREACGRANRHEDAVRLVAVTKTVDMEEVKALSSLGVRDFGENRVAELVRKTDALADLGASWHMIGHLQRNKAKDVPGRVALIHSLESRRLAEVLDRRAADARLTQDVLIEVNIAGEEAKYGVSPEAAKSLAETVAALPHLRLRGLMTMCPIVTAPEETRCWFAALRELACALSCNLPPGAMSNLSMGMTQDFEVAVEEGATLVRVGSALFA